MPVRQLPTYRARMLLLFSDAFRFLPAFLNLCFSDENPFCSFRFPFILPLFGFFENFRITVIASAKPFDEIVISPNQRCSAFLATHYALSMRRSIAADILEGRIHFFEPFPYGFFIQPLIIAESFPNELDLLRCVCRSALNADPLHNILRASDILRNLFVKESPSNP